MCHELLGEKSGRARRRMSAREKKGRGTIEWLENFLIGEQKWCLRLCKPR